MLSLFLFLTDVCIQKCRTTMPRCRATLLVEPPCDHFANIIVIVVLSNWRLCRTDTDMPTRWYVDTDTGGQHFKKTKIWKRAGYVQLGKQLHQPTLSLDSAVVDSFPLALPCQHFLQLIPSWMFCHAMSSEQYPNHHPTKYLINKLILTYWKKMKILNLSFFFSKLKFFTWKLKFIYFVVLNKISFSYVF